MHQAPGHQRSDAHFHDHVAIAKGSSVTVLPSP